jgi:transposase
MESTGVSWKPVSHVLAGTVEVCIGNAHEMRRRPVTKTDNRDAAWIAERLAHGLVQPSFVPPPDMRAWRDVTRTRVVSDLFGVTGRRLLATLVAGARDSQG